MLFRSNDTATTEIYTSSHTLSLHDALPIPVHVHHLRRQLEAANANLAIHTIRGVGYILAEIRL